MPPKKVPGKRVPVPRARITEERETPDNVQFFGPDDVPHLIELTAGPQYQANQQKQGLEVILGYARVFSGARIAYDANEVHAQIKVSEDMETDALSHSVLRCGNFNLSCNPDKSTFVTVTVPDREYGVVINLGPSEKLMINRLFLYVEQPTADAVGKYGEKAFTAIPDSRFAKSTVAGRLWQTFKEGLAGAEPPLISVFAEYNETGDNGGQVALYSKKEIRIMHLDGRATKRYTNEELIATDANIQSAVNNVVVVRGPGRVYLGGY